LAQLDQKRDCARFLQTSNILFFAKESTGRLRKSPQIRPCPSVRDGSQ
jgi:hypothetical protein